MTVSTGSVTKVAVTVAADVTGTVQLPVPLQPPPPQPVNVEPAVAVALSVTLVPVTNEELHVPGQERPPGLEVTEPEPLPLKATPSAAPALNVAETERSEPTLVEQVAAAPQPAPV